MKPDTPATNLPPLEYANGEPTREGPMDIGTPRPEATPAQSTIESLPQTISVGELAERSKNGGLS